MPTPEEIAEEQRRLRQRVAAQNLAFDAQAAVDPTLWAVYRMGRENLEGRLDRAPAKKPRSRSGEVKRHIDTRDEIREQMVENDQSLRDRLVGRLNMAPEVDAGVGYAPEPEVGGGFQYAVPPSPEEIAAANFASQTQGMDPEVLRAIYARQLETQELGRRRRVRGGRMADSFGGV